MKSLSIVLLSLSWLLIASAHAYEGAGRGLLLSTSNPEACTLVSEYVNSLDDEFSPEFETWLERLACAEDAPPTIISLAYAAPASSPQAPGTNVVKPKDEEKPKYKLATSLGGSFSQGNNEHSSFSSKLGIERINGQKEVHLDLAFSERSDKGRLSQNTRSLEIWTRAYTSGHWGGGLYAGVKADRARGMDSSASGNGVIEYNFFAYTDEEKREVSIDFGAGHSYTDQDDGFIYNFTYLNSQLEVNHPLPFDLRLASSLNAIVPFIAREQTTDTKPDNPREFYQLSGKADIKRKLGHGLGLGWIVNVGWINTPATGKEQLDVSHNVNLSWGREF